MIFYVSDDFLHYEAGNLFRVFYPYEQLKVTKEPVENPDLSISLGESTAEIRVFELCEIIEVSGENSNKETQISAKLFSLLEQHSGYSPKWGILTGIHPVRLYLNYEDAHGEAEAVRIFKENFLVTKEKIDYLKEIAEIQRPFIYESGKMDFSLYVSIPFCPSRCNYCSFVSQSTEKTDKLVAPYFDLLLEEVSHTAKIVKDLGLTLKSVYIGGGTPTTLNSLQLETLIQCIRDLYDFTYCTEFTVEAGRADTIDRGKLEALKKCGINRISINPQSLNDEVLKLIGRKHSAQDVLDKYSLAKKVGFDEINMDIIAGLQGDDFESFKSTLEKIIELEPENITVHSLALKKSADIFRNEGTKDYHGNRYIADSMVEYSKEKLTEAGFIPYYLYRQSRMAGNCENTGWCKPRTECAYNIYTMDEGQTIIACGAGAVSKIKDPNSRRLDRIFNFKYPYEYIDRFSEIIQRKNDITRLYSEYLK